MNEESAGGRIPWIVAGVIAALGAAAIFAYMTGGNDTLTGPVKVRKPVQTGTACSPLNEARSALGENDDDLLVGALREAERAALSTLQRDDASFGPPEFIAVRLSADLPRPPLTTKEKTRIRTMLTKASEECGS